MKKATKKKVDNTGKKKGKEIHYVCRNLMPYNNYIVKKAFQNVFGSTTKFVDELHVTTIYSTKPFKKFELDNNEFVRTFEYHIEVWDTPDGDVAVMVLDNAIEFVDRHEYFVELGGKPTHKVYRPHISLTYDLNPKIYDSVGKGGLFTIMFTGEKYSMFLDTNL